MFHVLTAGLEEDGLGLGPLPHVQLPFTDHGSGCSSDLHLVGLVGRQIVHVHLGKIGKGQEIYADED